jgi:uncharacterized protein (TIGR02145 family)
MKHIKLLNIKKSKEMKKTIINTLKAGLFFLLTFNFSLSTVFAQAPNAFNYQAVAHASNGDLITNQAVSFRISILQGSVSGTSVYSETHSATTNKYGLVNLQIGNGTTGDDFTAINWANGPYFVKVEMDATGGTTYAEMGTSQLLSVPFALAAGELLLYKDGKSYKTYLKDDGGYAGLVNIEVVQPFDTTPTVTDTDGNVYGTVKIGNQVWMTENLRTTKYNDDSNIPLVTDGTAWSNLDTSGYCWYNNDSTANAQTYGALYNWYTVNTNKLCPTGWHVPTDAEWTVLTDYLGVLAGGRLKETGTAHWNDPNTDAINDSKFTALPGGARYNNGTFNHIGSFGYWWIATEGNAIRAWYLRMRYNADYIDRNIYDKLGGFSVRCLRD